MPIITTQALGSLEAEILQLIWERTDPVTVKEIYRVLAARRAIAYTTVMTTMLRLSEKGMLHREQLEERHNAAYRYRAVLRHQDVLLARVEQVLASADEVERQYVAQRSVAPELGTEGRRFAPHSHLF
jgi:predicted transcriptional regulator